MKKFYLFVFVVIVFSCDQGLVDTGKKQEDPDLNRIESIEVWNLGNDLTDPVDDVKTGDYIFSYDDVNRLKEIRYSYNTEDYSYYVKKEFVFWDNGELKESTTYYRESESESWQVGEKNCFGYHNGGLISWSECFQEDEAGTSWMSQSRNDYSYNPDGTIDFITAYNNDPIDGNITLEPHKRWFFLETSPGSEKYLITRKTSDDKLTWIDDDEFNGTSSEERMWKSEIDGAGYLTRHEKRNPYGFNHYNMRYDYEYNSDYNLLYRVVTEEVSAGTWSGEGTEYAGKKGWEYDSDGNCIAEITYSWIPETGVWETEVSEDETSRYVKINNTYESGQLVSFIETETFIDSSGGDEWYEAVKGGGGSKIESSRFTEYRISRGIQSWTGNYSILLLRSRALYKNLFVTETRNFDKDEVTFIRELAGVME